MAANDVPAAPARSQATSAAPAPVDWHASPVADVLRRLGTGERGLTQTEARVRLAQHGGNVLPEEKQPSAAALLLRQLQGPLIYVLLAAAGVAFALGDAADGAVVLAVVVVNTVLGFAQEQRARRAIAALAELVDAPARARRDGGWVEIPAEELVPGDVVSVSEGDRIAADLRLIHTDGLRAEEAALTGEPASIAKGPEPVSPAAPLGERRDMLFAGTLVAGGGARGVAVATGSDTELGRISTTLGEVDPLETPLTRELDRVGRVVTIAVGCAAIALAAAAALRGFAASDAALAGIGLAVAAVPEGLPAVVTLGLAIGVQRMARRRAIVRRLPAVEALGSATIIASDKTGTLTTNRLQVETMWSPSGDVSELLLAAILCNDAVLASDAPGALGDPTETALLREAVRLGVDVDGARARHPRLATVPVSAERRFMATLHDRCGGAAVLFVKGAPETLLPRCGNAPRADVAAHVDRMAASGQRVLLIAARDQPPPGDPIDAVTDLRLLGLAGLVDPPRPEAREAVEACRRAGIRVLMVTGDHPGTAIATARAVGIDDGTVVTGSEIDRFDDQELAEAARRASVFARAAPLHKLRLVRVLQHGGEVVATTGDGVNDAPALRQAAIGVAMGRAGTATAKEAADIVLADDNFATLRAAVHEGRRVYDNLVKALAFVLPTSVGQALIIAIAVLAFPLRGGEPQLPIEPVQILWINLIVAVTLALPLAFEAAEPDIMDRPPRAATDRLLDRPLLVRTLLVAVTMTAVALALFELEFDRQLADGVEAPLALARAQTTAVTGAVLLQAFYLLTCRSLTRPTREIGRWSNPAVYIGIAAVCLLQLAFVTVPAMHAIFGSALPDLRALAAAAGAAFVVFPVVWIEERWRVRALRGQRARWQDGRRPRRGPQDR